jgi:hypothetical protein
MTGLGNQARVQKRTTDPKNLTVKSPNDRACELRIVSQKPLVRFRIVKTGEPTRNRAKTSVVFVQKGA